MKRGIKILLIVLAIIIILLVAVYILLFNQFGSTNKSQGQGSTLVNPMQKILEQNNNNQEAAISEGVKEFNATYINYILIALGIGNLHNSIIGGNPSGEISLDGETWNFELNKNALSTGRGSNASPDIRIKMSKEEAVKSLLAQNMKQFMKDSYNNGNTKIELVANKAILLSKGYANLI